jgi:hypothetical protein
VGVKENCLLVGLLHALESWGFLAYLGQNSRLYTRPSWAQTASSCYAEYSHWQYGAVVIPLGLCLSWAFAGIALTIGNPANLYVISGVSLLATVVWTLGFLWTSSLPMKGSRRVLRVTRKGILLSIFWSLILCSVAVFQGVWTFNHWVVIKTIFKSSEAPITHIKKWWFIFTLDRYYTYLTDVGFDLPKDIPPISLINSNIALGGYSVPESLETSSIIHSKRRERRPFTGGLFGFILVQINSAVLSAFGKKKAESL